MIRVYIDWNVLSDLKQYSTSKEPFTSLNRTLLDNKDKILIPYTSAHLSDLSYDFNKSEKARTETHLDLEYLATITENHCIVYDSKTKETSPGIQDIHEYFNEIVERNSIFNGGMSGFSDIIKETGFESLWSIYFDALKLLPSGLKQNYFDETSSQFQLIKDTFSGLSQNNSFYELFSGSFNLISQYFNNPKAYKSLRNNSLQELRMTHDYSKSQNPVKDISKSLEKSMIKKSFKEFADYLQSLYFKTETPSRIDAFLNYYILLDFLGYHKDKEFKNLMQDAFHSYYGAHCDFFITGDDNTYNKAKTLYDYLNITTTVCKPDEFNSEFYGKVILKNSSKQKFTSTFKSVINSSLVIPTHDSNFNPVSLYKADFFILNYFNRVQVTDNQDGTISIYAFKSPKNYSSFYFWKEIEAITNLVSFDMGPDIYNRYEYIPEVENKELLENKWSGRIWNLNDIYIELNMGDSPIMLNLSIDFMK